MSDISKRTYDLNDKKLDAQIASLKEDVDTKIGDIQSVLEAINAQINTFKGV